MRLLERHQKRTFAPPQAGPVHTCAADVETTAAHLRGSMRLRACWFEPWPYDCELPVIETNRIVLPADEPGVAPFSTWSPDNGVALPVRSATLELGRFVLLSRTPTVGVAWTPEARARALALAAHLGRALQAHFQTEGIIA
jgi:hypothetical protein